MRRLIIAGNWKMNKTAAEAASLVGALRPLVASVKQAEIVVCPPFTSLAAVAPALAGTNIGLGAQDMHWESNGAYTGEVSAEMLLTSGCRFVILGHSERRTHFHETDADVNKKVKAALAAGLRPIMCVGETLEQRERGETERVVKGQTTAGLAGLTPAEIAKVVIAYEPIWAIGTGKTATPDQAQAVHAFIRKVLGEISNKTVADAVRIQYGGSVKPENAKELFGKPDIDGGLIGGASLKADSFADIVKAAV